MNEGCAHQEITIYDRFEDGKPNGLYYARCEECGETSEDKESVDAAAFALTVTADFGASK